MTLTAVINPVVPLNLLFPLQRVICPQSRQSAKYRILTHNFTNDDLTNGKTLVITMRYLMRSVKKSAEVVGIFTEESWDVKVVNPLYNMVSGRFNLKINKRFDSLSCLSVIRYLYTSSVYIIRELN